MSALVLPSPALLAKCRKGILFSAPMMLALLAGQKTVTRRMSRTWLTLKPGDLLYTRETLHERPDGTWEYSAGNRAIELPHTDPRCAPMIAWAHHQERDYCPSIHMPTWASRLVIEVTEPPRLERVQDITEEDAMREAVGRGPACDARCTTAHRCGFIDTWHRLHTKVGERWQDNPDVVRIAFERAA